MVKFVPNLIFFIFQYFNSNGKMGINGFTENDFYQVKSSFLLLYVIAALISLYRVSILNFNDAKKYLFPVFCFHFFIWFWSNDYPFGQ